MLQRQHKRLNTVVHFWGSWCNQLAVLHVQRWLPDAALGQVRWQRGWFQGSRGRSRAGVFLCWERWVLVLAVPVMLRFGLPISPLSNIYSLLYIAPMFSKFGYPCHIFCLELCDEKRGLWWNGLRGRGGPIRTEFNLLWNAYCATLDLVISQAYLSCRGVVGKRKGITGVCCPEFLGGGGKVAYICKKYIIKILNYIELWFPCPRGLMC